MYTYRLTVAFALLTVSSILPAANAKDVDAQQFLNDKLAAKPGVFYTRQIPAHKICTTVIKHDRCSKGAEGGCADNSYEVTQCKIDQPAGVEKYVDAARASNSRIVSVQDLAFDQKNTVSLPEKAILNSVEYQNCDDVSLSQTVMLSVTGTKSVSVAKSNTLSTTQGGSITLSGKFFGAAASTTYNFSQTVGYSSQTTEGSSTAVVRSSSTTVSIGPRRSGRFELLAYETTVEIPYSAKIIVDGDLVANESGVTLASQLLTAEERTILFSGVLRLTDVSNAVIRTIPAAKPDQCPAGAQGLIVQTNAQKTMPAQAIPAETKKKFSPLKSFFSKVTSAKLKSVPLETLSEGPVIGPADGIGYEVVSSEDVSKPAPFCGFNDLGLMNLGIFAVETRRYTQYSNGTQVASWIDQVETFKQCWP